MRAQINSFSYGYPVFPESFVENTVLFLLNSLGTLLENHLTTIL